MSDKIRVRLVRPEDSEKIIRWIAPHTESLDLLRDPTLEIFCAENGRSLLFVPTRMVVMIDCLGSNPEATETEKAISLYRTMKTIEALAAKSGIREIAFMSGDGDDKIEKVAQGYGFEPVPWKVWRKKVGGSDV